MADKIAPVPTTHNPKAFFIVSFVALAANLALFAYQAIRIIRNKKNPLRDEIYSETNTYRKVLADNV
jgi:hypothetical protein